LDWYEKFDVHYGSIGEFEVSEAGAGAWGVRAVGVKAGKSGDIGRQKERKWLFGVKNCRKNS
jgi:hypothetical protein